MKAIAFMLGLPVFLSGCASTPEHIEVMSIRTRPIELVVEIKKAQKRFDSAPYRYKMTVLVLEPVGKRGATLHFVLDGVSEEWEGFTEVGSKWMVRADEEAFDHEKWIGLSFWTVQDLRPAPVVLRSSTTAFVRFGDLDVPLQLRSQPLVGYTAAYGQSRFGARATVSAVVEEDGNVVVVSVDDATTAEVGRLATETVIAWEFGPPTHGGKPARVRLKVRFRSDLDSMGYVLEE